ncbi:hypothetical protein [Priestia megaterium]|uniref:hypothetical protein n=1 Tax=Priestia megaterium TaxID=1404 RepID=UPI00159B8836|nr:hypothetical protein [Priestia megaterium]
MMILSADTEQHFNLDYMEGTLHVVENSSFRIVMLVTNDKKFTTILSVKEL